ncbi:cysteine hydrolase [Mesorhizobium sp. CA6]|nr:cysteine hydrolase [Mesorhizobium sp. CA6]
MHPLVIDAKPQPISIDLANAAVLVVDMQNDFGSQGGMFDRAGIDISGIQRAVGPTARVIATARGLRVPVIYLKMGYCSDLSDLGTSDAPNRLRHLQIFGVGESMMAPDGSESRIRRRSRSEFRDVLNWPNELARRRIATIRAFSSGSHVVDPEPVKISSRRTGSSLLDLSLISEIVICRGLQGSAAAAPALKIGGRLAIWRELGHKPRIAGTGRLDGSEAALRHKADPCHLRGLRIGFM